MRDAEEHKKLLAQIAELEKNSTNFFDVEKEFFLITSDNLAEVKTRFYGYSIQATGIYEEDNLTPEAAANLDGRGCYVYVEVKNGQITIKQDLNGSWGIYLFRHGDYFALSNSFFRLLDHVKFKYPLTVNRDYFHYFVVEAICSNAYSETAINEICLVDRSAIFHIDIANKNLQIELINYKEHSLPLDSEEGIATLDRWIELWSSVLKGVAQYTNFIQANLSGGFDTRIAFVPLLNSGIDLNKIRIFSIKNDLHTYTEDYEIATKIANHYGFKLNQSLPKNPSLNLSLSDVFNLNLHTCQTFSPILGPWGQKSVNTVYCIGGAAGETIRRNWSKFGSLRKFIEDRTSRTNHYSYVLSRELSRSTEIILKSAFHNIGNRYGIKDHEDILLQYLCQETQCRNHFGKDILRNYLINVVLMSPVLDPYVRTLQLTTKDCPDYNLLVTLLFVRYAPDLLTFPFNTVANKQRIIAPETIAYAKRLNERFPIYHKKVDNLNGRQAFHLQPRDTKAEKIFSSGRNNSAIPDGLPKACLKATFESSKTYGLFTSYFDEELYHYAATVYDTHVFGRDRRMYSVVGITRVLEDVEISQRNHSPYRDMQRYLEQDFAPIHTDAQIITKLAPYITARIDVKLRVEGDFQILNVSDNRAKITKPAWFQNNGVGYMITSYVGKLEFTAKAAVDGQIAFFLRGLDVRRLEDNSKRIPYWIDYTKLIINGEKIFDTLTPVWHDKPYAYNMDVKAGAEIKIQVEWLPHRSDT